MKFRALFPPLPKAIRWQQSVSSRRSASCGFVHLDACRENVSHFSRLEAISRTKSTVTSPHYDTKPKPILQVTNDGDAGGENKLGREGVGNDYSILIEDDGNAISISSANTTNDHAIADDNTGSSWSFSSPLLWVNDPQYIHASSGQRTRTLGQYSKTFEIASARVIYINGGDDEESNEKSRIELGMGNSIPNFHPVPPLGSMHSRGGICGDTPDNNCTTTRSHSRALIEIEWNYGETSFFDLDWLIDHARHHCLGRWVSKKDFPNEIYSENKDFAQDYSKIGLNGTTKTTAVTKEIAIGAIGNSNAAPISRFDYREILEYDDTLFAGMQEIFEHGAILIQNAPNVEDVESIGEESSITPLESIVGNLGRRMSGGTLSHGSLYGDVFHVQSKVDAENIAYTNVALPPHQDLTYYESKPFLQLLHCATNSSGKPDNESNPSNTNGIIGGESVLIDGMAAAEELRRAAPDLFDILCKTEATFVKERHDSDMVSPKPHIVVDPAHGQVVEVNWSPPFEGPLQIHPRVAVEDYVRAYQAMECILDDNLAGDDSNGENNPTFLHESLQSFLRNHAKEYTWEFALQKGDVLVFNNQRMLHGRRSFSSFGSLERHLVGCYTDAMDTVSRYRQLLRDREGKSGGGYGRRNPGSGYRWM